MFSDDAMLQVQTIYYDVCSPRWYSSDHCGSNYRQRLFNKFQCYHQHLVLSANPLNKNEKINFTIGAKVPNRQVIRLSWIVRIQ